MQLFLKRSILLLITPFMFGQTMEEVNPPENIKSIIFKGENDDQFPVVQIGESIFWNLTTYWPMNRIITIK